MKNVFKMLTNVVLFGVLPGVAGAAGTYYDNSIYQRYGSNNTGYNTSSRSYAARYNTQQQTTAVNNQMITNRSVSRNNTQKNTKNSAKKQGWIVDAGLSHEFANWKFDMTAAGSELSYDNLVWNVLGANATYYFGENTPMQVKFGARYGMQFGESQMIDDDISKGGYLVTTWTDGSNILGYQTGHALSVGTSKDGTQMGFNAAFGLTDYLKWGRVKFTPSIGYRYLNYKLTTQNNHGVAIDILESTNNHPYITCIEGYMGEIQCDPILLFYGEGGNVTLTGHVVDETSPTGISELIQMPSSTVMTNVIGIGTGGTYYYEQSGTSHEYKTTWAGPYIAMDAEYVIDSKNAVSGSLEIGLPIYKSEGNQPYRYDWAHPKSVEDTGKFGDAMHLGLAALYKTQVADSTMLTLGFTYDYYKVSKATAKTFLSSSYYMDLRDGYSNMLDDSWMTDHGYDVLTDAEKATVQEEIDGIDAYKNQGWVLESPSEISSIYKSMGIRIGLEMKF